MKSLGLTLDPSILITRPFQFPNFPPPPPSPLPPSELDPQPPTFPATSFPHLPTRPPTGRRQLPKLCGVAADCASAFSRDFWLQTNLFRAGVLWHLIPRLFQYDFTLEESGVEQAGEGEANAQVGAR